MTGVKARAVVEAAVRRELFGPEADEDPTGEPLDCSGPSITFTKAEDSYGQFHDQETLQEVLTQSDPLRRYGIGVLFSGGTLAGSTTADGRGGQEDGEDEPLIIAGLPENPENPDKEPLSVGGTVRHDASDSDDFDLSDANRRKPSAMAVSFKVRVSDGASLELAVSGAYYDKLTINLPAAKREWWVRRPFEVVGAIPGIVLRNELNKIKLIDTIAADTEPRVKPTMQVFSRLVPGEDDPGLRLVTIAAVNQVPGTGPGSALFQIGFTVTAAAGADIEPYPNVEQPDSDEEEQSIVLLYRHKRTFAIGHGCAADWGDEPVAWVKADPLPAYEVASLTPDVFEVLADGSSDAVSVSMAALADGTPDGQAQVEKVLGLYEQWIADQTMSIANLPEHYQQAAERHMRLCQDALDRMRTGWHLVQSDPRAQRAFRLANEGMLFQQVRSRFPLREVEKGRDGIYRPKGAHPAATLGPKQGRWRAFQIAFILASLPELVDRTAPRRELVDLIFFPTGGGKTEAYLGAAAISLLARRLLDPDDAGTDTLMRYTLRLLTAQQFLRAASLICVLEDIRSRFPKELGERSFGIGVWLGGDSTPNSWQAAVKNLKGLQSNYMEQNRFLLLKCPWCGAQMGPKRRQSRGQDTVGYVQVGNRVVLRCIDDECPYNRRSGLPVHVVDEDIYDVRPSLVIGTVDKFATMAWRPAARNLFGLGDDGEREVSPPGLIVQDELHLISGPLGSMVGLYEPVIDELCTDRRGPDPVVPKIIASTATVRRYEEQIKGLFGRIEVALFPPHGLEEGHSFFAEPATLADGSPAPGRRYLGVMSPSLGSTQTVQVRVASATLQAGPRIPESDRDGYWTNLNFLNSLRELGNTVSLIESDIPDYLVGLRRRDGIDPRWPRNTMELTSRRRSDEIPKAIEELEVTINSDRCVDICLASNIIEVGVDIDRLGLMTIVGQPKTTAQYIQVSGRVGRRSDVPGLVITIYGAAKPRDRSHYERFRTYHQQLYAQVEPTSVTPFAEPVLRRALHAAAIAYMRQVEPTLEPYPFPQAEFDDAVRLIRSRAELADESELAKFDALAKRRAREWDKGERTVWSASPYGRDGDPKQGLMRPAGMLPDIGNRITWDVPTSMRSVDAECRLQITQAYNLEDAAPQDGEL